MTTTIEHRTCSSCNRAYDDGDAATWIDRPDGGGLLCKKCQARSERGLPSPPTSRNQVVAPTEGGMVAARTDGGAITVVVRADGGPEARLDVPPGCAWQVGAWLITAAAELQGRRENDRS